MIEPLQQRMLLARMEAAEGDTRRHLRIIERQIVSRAERLTVTDRVKRRQPRRGASTWTRADERLFQQLVAELTLARRGEIDALTCKLERQELAIVVLRSRPSSPAARNGAASRRGHSDEVPGRQRRNGGLGGDRPIMASRSRFAVERRASAITPSVCAAV